MGQITKVSGIILICWSTFVTAGELVQEDRAVADFHTLSVSMTGDFRLEQGEMASLSIRALPETLKRLKTEVIAGDLRVSLEDARWWRDPGPIDVLITYRQLDALLLTGSAEVQTDRLTGATFEVEITGSAEVEVPDMAVDVLQVTLSGSGALTVDQLASKAVEIVVSGSGDVTLAGVTEQQTVTVRGSGTVANQALESVRGKVLVSGSGNAIVHATRALEARVSGSGNIRYLGDPDLDREVTGSGKIRPDH